jgi:serine/threonine-protein kinase
MEYIDGVDGYRLLRRLRQEDELIPVGVAIYVAREVLRGLESVHAARDPLSGGALGIVHRDVSPSNIYLSNDGRVKLGDFGIARSTTRTTLRSEAGQVLKGKFAYMSPEQARGEGLDARTDVFALGVTLWELLTGARLFEGDGDVAVLRAVQERLIVPPARLNPAVSSALDSAVMRALERDRARRWPTAHELERALAEVVLVGARSLEDTDVGAFLRRMFPEEAGVAEPAPGTGSIPISLSTSAPPAATASEASPAGSTSRAPPTERVTPAPAEPGALKPQPQIHQKCFCPVVYKQIRISLLIGFNAHHGDPMP